MRPYPVVTALLENDDEALADPYSGAMSVIAAALSFARRHHGDMNDSEDQVIGAVLSTIARKDEHSSPDDIFDTSLGTTETGRDE